MNAIWAESNMRSALDFDTCSPLQLKVTQFPMLQSSPSVAGETVSESHAAAELVLVRRQRPRDFGIDVMVVANAAHGAISAKHIKRIVKTRIIESPSKRPLSARAR